MFQKYTFALEPLAFQIESLRPKTYLKMVKISDKNQK